jgi:hypothetical protein
MARRIAIPSKHVELKIVGNENALTVPRIQRLSLTADRPSTDIDELGNPLHAGTVEDVPAVTVTFQSMDVGVKLWSVLTGTDWLAYPASGVSITEIDEVDVIAQVRNDTVEDYVKMAHARRCVVRDFSFNYSVDGESTEEYTLVGTQKRWFTNDVVVERFGAGAGPFALAESPVTLKNGNECISVIADGIYLEEVASGEASGEYSVSGSNVSVGDAVANQVLIVYQAAPAGNNWSDISDVTMPAAIRGLDVPIQIEANGIDRVQSVTLNGAFNPEAVREMGNRDIVGYQIQVPSVTGTLSVLDTDNELISLFTTGQLAPADTEFRASEYTFAGLELDVILQDPADLVEPFDVLKTVYVPELEVTSEGFTSNVNANAQQTFDIKSSTGNLIVYSGARA